MNPYTRVDLEVGPCWRVQGVPLDRAQQSRAPDRGQSCGNWLCHSVGRRTGNSFRPFFGEQPGEINKVASEDIFKELFGSSPFPSKEVIRQLNHHSLSMLPLLDLFFGFRTSFRVHICSLIQHLERDGYLALHLDAIILSVGVQAPDISKGYGLCNSFENLECKFGANPAYSACHLSCVDRLPFNVAVP